MPIVRDARRPYLANFSVQPTSSARRNSPISWSPRHAEVNASIDCGRAGPGPARADRLPGSGRSPGLARLTDVVGRGGDAVGWAFDDSSPTSPVRVDIYADGTLVWSANAEDPRPDVASAFPGVGASQGYNATFATSTGNHQVCAFAINVGSGLNNTQLGCSSVTAVDLSPVGSVDQMTRNGVEVGFSGWTFDPESADPIAIKVSVNFGDVVVVAADADRPDIAAAYPSYGASHGFVSSILVPYYQQLDPSVTICITAVNIRSGADKVLDCRNMADVTPDPRLSSPTYLHGTIRTLVNTSPGTLTITGRLIDDFDPNDQAAVYFHVTQSFGDVAGGTGLDLTDPSGSYGVVITGVPAGPMRVCLGGFESYANIPRTIDCRDIVVT